MSVSRVARCTRVLLFLLIALVSGCAMRSVTGLSPQFDVEVKNAPRGVIDLGVARDSEAMHRFLTGQLSYLNEDFHGALKNLGRASELISEPQPELHYRLSELYLKSGEVEKALSEITAAVEGDDDNPRYLILQAGLLEVAGRQAEAVPVYEKLIATNSAAFEGYLGLASLYLRDGQEENGLSVARRFVTAAPSESIGVILLSRILEESGSLAEAAFVLESFGIANPDNMEVAVHLIRIYLTQERAVDALALVSMMLLKKPAHTGLKSLQVELSSGVDRQEALLSELKPAQTLSDESGADARFRLATLEIQNQNATDALLNLSIVLAEDPGREDARYYMASIYAAAARRKEAVEELLRIRSGSPYFVRARSFAALLLREEGDLAGAEDAMFSAFEEEPDNYKLLTFLVLVLREQKKFERAGELMRRAIDESPSDDSLLFQYAVLLHDAGEEKEALRVMHEAVRINPDNSDALNYIAYTMAERGENLDEAKELVQRALRIKSGDGYYLDTMGWIHFQSGNYAIAEPILKQAMDLSDQDVVISEHYGDCLVKLDRVKQAREVYKLALDKAQGSRSEEDQKAGKRIEKKLADLVSASSGRAGRK